MIILKTPEEIEKMRASNRLVAETLALLASKAEPGMTTLELNRLAEEYCRDNGGEPSFLGYSGFPYSLCASVNEQVVHGFPSKRRLKEKDTEYVFTNHKGDKIPQLTKAFWTAIREAGLIRYETQKDGSRKKIRFRFHDLRHTFGSRLGMAGYDLKTIMEIMGHKSHRVAMRYQHPAPDHKLAAVESLAQVPTEITTGRVIQLKGTDITGK